MTRTEVISDSTGSAIMVSKGEADRIRVLVADRNAHYRETIRRVLERYDNCSVVAEASTLPEAIVMLNEKNPDLVLLDFDLVAHEKQARLRRLAQAYPSLRVVVLLADDSLDYRQAVESRWGYACVAKDRVEEQLGPVIAGIGSAVR